MEFYIHNVKIRLTFGFFAVWAIILIQSTSSLTAVMSLLACLLHESGHLLAMKICGAGAERIIFYSGGIALKRHIGSAMPHTSQEIFILSGGCIVNLLLFIISEIAGARLFGMINLVLMMFNLLPLPSLDGGRIIMLLAEKSDPAADISGVMRGIELICGIAAAVFFILKGSVNFTLPLTLAMIILEGIIDRDGQSI